MYSSLSNSMPSQLYQNCYGTRTHHKIVNLIFPAVYEQQCPEKLTMKNILSVKIDNLSSNSYFVADPQISIWDADPYFQLLPEPFCSLSIF